MRKLATACLITLLCAMPSTLLADSPNPTTDCPEGLVCLLPAEAIALREKNLDLRARIVELEEDLGIAKAKRLRRIGHNVGCGGGLAVVDGAGTWEVGLYCGYLFGWRF